MQLLLPFLQHGDIYLILERGNYVVICPNVTGFEFINIEKILFIAVCKILFIHHVNQLE